MSKLPKETTPTTIHDSVINIGTDAPEFVPVVKIEGAKHGVCYHNVTKKIKKSGGEFVAGWCVWEVKELLLTCEFHVVWQNKLGKLIDVTPKPDRENEILFVPDNRYGADINYEINLPQSILIKIYTGENAYISNRLDEYIDAVNEKNRMYVDGLRNGRQIKATMWHNVNLKVINRADALGDVLRQ